MATIPTEMEVEAYFLAKDDGIVAGIALAEMIFNEVDPTLKVLTNNTPYQNLKSFFSLLNICGCMLFEML